MPHFEVYTIFFITTESARFSGLQTSDESLLRHLLSKILSTVKTIIG